MKKIVQITLLALLCGITTLAWAQPDENPETVRPAAREKIKALRIGFFTEKLDLQPAESEKFWVLYNEFATQQQKFNQEQKTKPNFAAMTDAEAEKAVAKHLDIRQRELDLQKNFVEKLKKVLPIKKIAMLPSIEHEFKRDLLRSLKEERNTPPPPPRPRQ